MALARALAVLVCLASCTSDPTPGVPEACGAGGTCPLGYVCNSRDNLCYATGSSPDAAPIDAGLPPDAPVDAPPPGCDAGTTFGTRVQVEFDSRNAEWVKSLKWLDSASVLTGNLANAGGPAGCSGPVELFGQVFGAPEGSEPGPVGSNTLATNTVCGPEPHIVSAPFTCDPTPEPQIPVTTDYHFYTGAQASQVRITRTIGFDATTPVYSGVGIRPYVPRLPLSQFTTVIYPNAAGTATTSTGLCPNDCLTDVGATWSGKWFADVAPASGLAMIVLRDPSMTSPVQLTVNYDGSSASNLSSFVLVQPSGGWKAAVTEIEYLCFADLTSWPQDQRDAATLPAGCGP